MKKIEAVIKPYKLDDVKAALAETGLLGMTVVEVRWTGSIGDGKIFVSDVEQAVRIRTGERAEAAL